MRPAFCLPGRSLAVLALVAIAVPVAPVLAQTRDEDGEDSSSSSPSQTPSDRPTASSSRDTPKTSSSSSEKPSPTPSSTSTPPETTEAPETTSSSSRNVASITGSDETTGADFTGLPTLTRGGAIPEYPAPSVPPTRNAPFMQHSSAPDGTVFIAVGAILGAFGLGILLWRAIVSLLLHRSVRRAAMAQHDANSKAGFPAPPAPFYKYTDQSSPGGPPGGPGGSTRGVRRTSRGPGVPSANLSHSGLFFSPTAAASNSGPGGRGSTFLPSGFYAAGTSSPGGGQHGPSISLTNLRPDSRGQPGNASRNTLNPSPPESPHFSPRRDMSTSSVNLHNLQPGQRAPSAYLEDLLTDDPSSFPPPHMPPSAGPRHSVGRSSNRH